MQQLYDQTLHSIREWESSHKCCTIDPVQYISKPVLVVYDRTVLHDLEGWALAVTLSTVTVYPRGDYYHFYAGSEESHFCAQDLGETFGVGSNFRYKYFTTVDARVDCNVDGFVSNYKSLRRDFSSMLKRDWSKVSGGKAVPFKWDLQDFECVWITNNYKRDERMPEDVIVMDLAVKTPQQWLDWWIERHPEVKAKTCLLL